MDGPHLDEPAGSSSAVEQHIVTDADIRSRRSATDVAQSVTASNPTTPENDGQVEERSDNDSEHTLESPRRSVTPPLESAPESAVPGTGTGAKTPEEKQCRICLAGPEEEAELGRLISPCLCRGSIRVREPETFKSN
jgi:hypothetical protein